MFLRSHIWISFLVIVAGKGNSAGNELLLPKFEDSIQVQEIELIRRLYTTTETVNFIFNTPQPFFPWNSLKNPRIIADGEEFIQGSSSNYHQNYVIYAKEHDSLNNSLMRLKSSALWNKSNSPRGKYLVITSVASGNSLSRFFEILWHHGILNVIIVLTKQEEAIFRVFTSNPFENGTECGKKVVKIVENKSGSNVCFRGCLKEIQGCNLQLLSPNEISRAMQIYGSYAIIFNVFQLISEKLRPSSASVLVVKNPKEMIRTQKNGDIFLVPLVSRASEFYEDYDLTDIFYSDQMSWIVPKASQITDIKIMISVFDGFMWSVMLFVFFVSSIAWWMIAQCSRNPKDSKNCQKSFLDVYYIFLWGSINVIPSTTSLRVLVLFYLIYCLETTTVFQARLMSVLTKPGREHQISTMKEFAESNLQPIIPHSFMSIAYANPENKNFVKLKARFVQPNNTNALGNVRSVAYNKNFATLLGQRIFSLYPRERVRMFMIDHNTGLLSVEASLAGRKGLFLMDTLNELSKRITESGFHMKVISDSAGSGYYKNEKDLSKAFSVYRLWGAFILWIAGLLVALGVFAGEIMLHYWYLLCRNSRKLLI